MSNDKEEKIKQRAYSIWQEEGHPHGRNHEHWFQAEREVSGASGGKESGKSAKQTAAPVKHREEKSASGPGRRRKAF